MPCKTEKKFNLNDFRVDKNAEECGKMVYSTVPVRRINPKVYSCIHPDPDCRVVLPCLEHEEEMTKTYYLSTPEIAADIRDDLKNREFIPCVTRDGAYFLWPVAYYESGRRMDSWTFLARAIIKKYPGKWIRVIPNSKTNSYDCRMAINQPSSPQWPEGGIEWLIETAFRDRIIDSHDHEILKQLRGEDVF